MSPIRAARLLSFVAIVSSIAPALLGDGLSKYKNWPVSPQGFFMTNAERAVWKATVKNDAEAEQFIKKFIDSRGPGFAEEVAKRAEMADKHLTVAGTAGSRTLRGKVVILLGPPSALTTSARDVEGERSSPLATSGYANSSLYAAGGGLSEISDASARQTMSGGKVSDYIFTYAPDRLPGKRTKDLVIVVEVNPRDGTDKLHEPMAPQLDEVFEAVAEARLAAAEARKP
jgi:GWxTD domain-containing protein